MNDLVLAAIILAGGLVAAGLIRLARWFDRTLCHLTHDGE